MFCVFHRDDVPWNEAPLPRRWHRCRAWTVGQVSGQYVERCACGAIWMDGFRGGWSAKNERRKSQRRQKKEQP